MNTRDMQKNNGKNSLRRSAYMVFVLTIVTVVGLGMTAFAHEQTSSKTGGSATSYSVSKHVK